jgi:tRNA threonylcarbamoyladenosine biosynthesis protein TsaB
MRVLAIETSTLAGGVALLDGGRVVAEYALDVAITHSERVMAAVDALVRDARWRPGDLQGIAVAVGPGSFTGLRIGLATAQGLAIALRLPIAAVPTLDAMAAMLPFAAWPVCPVIAARRTEVYASLYRAAPGEMRREWDYLALTPEVLAARLVEPTILVGDGAARVESVHARVAPAVPRVPSAAAVGALGTERLRRHETVAAASLTPLYLRPSEAELKRRVVAVA